MAPAPEKLNKQEKEFSDIIEVTEKKMHDIKNTEAARPSIPSIMFIMFIKITTEKVIKKQTNSFVPENKKISFFKNPTE